MEEDARANDAAEGHEQISIRAPERVMTSDRPPVELPSGWLFGRYELLGRLAFGGMAEIYLARESSQGLARRYVVIKRVLPHVASDEEFVGLFTDEARVAMSLTHPHITHIYEFGRIDGSYFLAMEWVNGVALNKLLKRARRAGRRLPVGHAVRIVSAVAEALDYAHAKKGDDGKPLGIVHRDTTPHNIMVTFDGSVKLLDFGIAMATSRNTHTRTGLVRGKLAYMSPQQCLAKPIDGRSDIFALGVCLYEAVTGRRLYRRETDFEICEAILRDPVPSAQAVDPDIPEALDQIIQRCLAKDPEERYQRAGDLQTALERFLAEQHEVVTTSALAELMRELFPVQYENGPKLETQTDLLKGLPRAHEGSGARVVASSAPPRAREPAVEEALAAEDPSTTRSALAEPERPDPPPPPPQRSKAMMVALVLALSLAGAMGAVAIWSLTRPTPKVMVAPVPVQPLGHGEPAPAAAITAPEPKPAPEAQEANGEGASAEESGESTTASDPKTTGSLWINSEPPGAHIFINSEDTGRTTPAQLEGFWPGAYRITLRKDGYETHRTRETVDAGKVHQVSVRMMTDAEAREFYRRRARERGSDEAERPDDEGTGDSQAPRGEGEPAETPKATDVSEVGG